ncbi:AMP-binding protein [Xenorhabdus sp. TH1]|uniref:AMP-binding protein n=1 Tax=Xenorhabdus sp. TH1 TaxID=3130166 RepID=UPI0030CA8B73
MKSEKTIHAQFMAQKMKTLHAVALRIDNSSINYEELDNRLTALAGYLIKQGVNPGDKIGVYFHKGVALIVSLLGIAGGFA